MDKKMDNRPICCGKPMNTPEEVGIRPDVVFSDDGWAWTEKDIAYVCSVCGAHILKNEMDLQSQDEESD